MLILIDFISDFYEWRYNLFVEMEGERKIYTDFALITAVSEIIDGCNPRDKLKTQSDDAYFLLTGHSVLVPFLT